MKAAVIIASVAVSLASIVYVCGLLEQHWTQREIEAICKEVVGVGVPGETHFDLYASLRQCIKELR